MNSKIMPVKYAHYEYLNELIYMCSIYERVLLQLLFLSDFYIKLNMMNMIRSVVYY